MKIYFTSSNSHSLCVKVSSDQVSTEDVVWLFANKESEKFVTLAAAQRLNDLFQAAVRLAREQSYEQGYKDGRAKRGKAKWHRSLL